MAMAKVTAASRAPVFRTELELTSLDTVCVFRGVLTKGTPQGEFLLGLPVKMAVASKSWPWLQTCMVDYCG